MSDKRARHLAYTMAYASLSGGLGYGPVILLKCCPEDLVGVLVVVVVVVVVVVTATRIIKFVVVLREDI